MPSPFISFLPPFAAALCVAASPASPSFAADAPKESAMPAASAPLDDRRLVAERANALAFPLLKAFAGDKAGENACISPVSAHGALMLAWEGARGRTADELAAVLGLPEGWDHARAHAATAGLHKDFSRDMAVTVALAGALWGQQGYAWDPAAKDALAKAYAAPFFEADFEKDPEGAARQVNAWAGERTFGRIKDLLKPDPGLRLVLANAGYFKGDWRSPFKPEMTHEEPFRQASGAVQTPMMHQSFPHVAYAENETAQILELPYAGDRFALTLVLPRKDDGLADLLARTDAKAWAKWLAALEAKPVEAALPRWEVKVAYDLIPALRGMGVKDLFDAKAADMRGFIRSLPAGTNLYASKAVQDVFCRVDEEGTEAAAATAVGFSLTSAPAPGDPPKVFRADHPFAYFLRDRQSGAILFAGTFAKPGR